MSESDSVLGLVDDLLRLAAGTPATSIEVEAEGIAVSLTLRPGAPRSARPAAAAPPSETRERTQRVHATTVGIFSATKDWKGGDAVTRGDVLGGIQSLGHVAEIVAPADGEIRDVLVPVGTPVEYGQPLFVIELR